MNAEPLLGLLQGAELAGPFHPVAGGSGSLVATRVLRLGDGRAEIAAAHAVFQRHERWLFSR